MISEMASPASHVVAFTLDGTVTGAELDQIIERLESALETHDRINILADVCQLSGLTPQALFKDLLTSAQWLGRLHRFNHLEMTLVGEEVNGHDVLQAVREIERMYHKQGQVGLLVHLKKFPSLASGLVYEKLRALKVMPMLSRYAVVAPSWVALAQGLTSVSLRHFKLDQLEAREWVAQPRL